MPTIGLAVQRAGRVGTIATNTFPPTPSPADGQPEIGSPHSGSLDLALRPDLRAKVRENEGNLPSTHALQCMVGQGRRPTRWIIGQIGIRCHISDPYIGPELCPPEMQIADHSVTIRGQGHTFDYTSISRGVVGKVDNIPTS